MKMFKRLLAAMCIIAITLPQAALAQLSFPTAASGVRVPGTVPLTCDASAANCAPASATNPAQVNQVDYSSTGSLGALNAVSALTLNGNGGLSIDVRGTFVGTITVQGTTDGTNWTALTVLPAGTGQGAVAVTTVSAPGNWTANAAGFVQVRANMTAYTSGSATVVLRASAVPNVVFAYVTGNTALTVNANASTNLIGDVGVQYRTTATGAAASTSILSPATPAGASIKASAGRLIGCYLTNSAAALRSVKFFNATAVTMGTTAAVFEIDLPANGMGYFDLPGGISFATGQMWAVTSAKGLTDNTATGLAANDVSGVCWAA